MALHDVRLAIARLRRSPRELPGLVLTLAVGVGLVGASYTVVSAVLYAPLPYRSPAELVRLWETGGTPGYRLVPSGHVQALRARARLLDSVSSYAGLEQELATGHSVGMRLRGQRVSANLFDLLGASPMMGRTFRPDDERPAAVLPVIVSERLVRRGAIRGQLGDTLVLGDLTHIIVGIMPSGFWFPDRHTDYWVPIVVVPPELLGGGVQSLSAPTIARLAPRHASLQAVEAEANGILASVIERPAMRVRSYADDLREPLSTPLTVLQIGSLSVLALALLNAGWLFVARARRFRQTFAIMHALGGSPARVFAGWLVEALVVGAVVTPMATAIAWLLLRGVQSFDNGEVSRVADTALTLRTVAMTALVATVGSVLSAVPAGLAVARRTAHRGVVTELRLIGRRRAVEYAVMIGQAGVVFALAIQSVLLLLVLQALFRANVGFQQTNLVAAHIDARASRVDPAGQALRYGQIASDLQQGGLHAAVVSILPLTGYDQLTSIVPATGDVRNQTMVRVRVVSPSYFSVTGFHQVSGRSLGSADVGHGRVVVNDAFPAKLLRQAAAGPRQITLSMASWEVVGVVSTIRHASLLEDPTPEIYLLYGDVGRLSARTASMVVQSAFVVASADGGTTATLDRIRSVVSRELPEAQVAGAWYFRDLLWLAAGARPLLTLGASAFAVVALVLMTAGFYGMIGDGLARRQREIGIRIALGATPARVVRESLAPAVGVYVLATVLGTLIVEVLRRAVTATVFIPAGVSAPDAAVVTGLAALVLALAAGLGCYKPVMQASRVDPAVTLKAE